MTALASRKLSRRSARAPALNAVAHPVLRRVLSHRGLVENELDLSLAGLLPWRELKGIDQAAACLADALCAQQHILIVGDYDADGATGVALAVSVLRELGARKVDYLVPDRVKLGYGLSPALAELALTLSPDVVVTVDNGISSVTGVARLREAGVAVVVTDHHLPGESLPQANAIVNPNQPGDAFASKALAGVGVMFYVLAALRHELTTRDYFDKQALTPPNLAAHLDLVALGTVADLVPLDGNNRRLVEQGLMRIRGGRARPGLAALIEVSGRKARELQASDMGFALGPRINAAGRLEHMNQGIACLLATSMSEARPLAAQLDQINQQRRAMQADMQDSAIAQVAVQATDEPALCLHDSSWHEGVVGLIASQVKERFHRPVIAFANAADQQLKGSGRSIAGFHLRDALALLDARHPGLIEKFGGHAMAAGLSIRDSDLQRFSQAFVQICAEILDPALLQASWLSDGELDAESLSLTTVNALRDAGPWGQGFDDPLFDNEFEIRGQRLVGSGHLKLRLALPGCEQIWDAIAFGVDERLEEARVRLVYQLDINDYYDPPSVQLIVRGRAA